MKTIVIPRADKSGSRSVKLIWPILELTVILRKRNKDRRLNYANELHEVQMLSSALNEDVHFFKYRYLKFVEKKISYIAVQKFAVQVGYLLKY